MYFRRQLFHNSARESYPRMKTIIGNSSSACTANFKKSTAKDINMHSIIKNDSVV